jgi:hypothetical protein
MSCGVTTGDRLWFGSSDARLADVSQHRVGISSQNQSCAYADLMPLLIYANRPAELFARHTRHIGFATVAKDGNCQLRKVSLFPGCQPIIQPAACHVQVPCPFTRCLQAIIRSYKQFSPCMYPVVEQRRHPGRVCSSSTAAYSIWTTWSRATANQGHRETAQHVATQLGSA